MNSVCFSQVWCSLWTNVFKADFCPISSSVTYRSSKKLRPSQTFLTYKLLWESNIWESLVKHIAWIWDSIMTIRPFESQPNTKEKGQEFRKNVCTFEHLEKREYQVSHHSQYTWREQGCCGEKEQEIFESVTPKSTTQFTDLWAMWLWESQSLWARVKICLNGLNSLEVKCRTLSFPSNCWFACIADSLKGKSVQS